jgi:hypothetical protein
MDPDAYQGGPKTYGYGSRTMVHLHHSSLIKEVSRKKQSESRFSNYFLLDDGRIRSRICTCDSQTRMRIREAQTHTDPKDPDSDENPEP